MFRTIPCSSSGGQTVLLEHLVLSFSVSSHSVTIPDAVTLQFDLLKMSMLLLETC